MLSPQPARVLEIGPGNGALTAPLLERFACVVALEVDEQLLPGLERRFAATHLDLRQGDALTVALDEVVGQPRPWQLASNLPYSVGTAILRRLLPRSDLFSRLVVMLQQEVVDRVVATPADKGHGLLALERAAWAEARVALQVSPQAFAPHPKVDSAVLVLDLHPPRFEAARLRGAFALAQRGLLKPRKMLGNALGVAAATIERAGLDPRRRPGSLTLEEWVELAATLR